MLSADRTHAPVVIRALGGLLTILPRAVNRAVRLICACHLFILRLVTLLCGTTYYYPAGSYRGERAGTTAVRGLVRRFRYLLC